MDQTTLKAAVRARYARLVTQNQSCCGPQSACGCSGSASETSLGVGYGLQDVQAVPEGANLGLGCGNPVALASLQPGDVVLDLGSGAGFDAFLASRRVGPEGRVVGVDMTAAMVARAQALAERHGYTNVSFLEGDIEALPLEDASVHVVMSNCVINLTPDKRQAFREAWRVLKPGGRLMISDLVLRSPLPEAVQNDLEAYVACLAGAWLKDDYLAAIRAAGFQDVEVLAERAYDLQGSEPEEAVHAPLSSNHDLETAMERIVSIQVRAIKALPAIHGCNPDGCP